MFAGVDVEVDADGADVVEGCIWRDVAVVDGDRHGDGFEDGAGFVGPSDGFVVVDFGAAEVFVAVVAFEAVFVGFFEDGVFVEGDLVDVEVVEAFGFGRE